MTQLLRRLYIMDCEKFYKNIENYLDGKLSTRSLEAFENHLYECKHCQTDYEDTKYIYESFKSLGKMCGLTTRENKSILHSLKDKVKKKRENLF